MGTEGRGRPRRSRPLFVAAAALALATRVQAHEIWLTVDHKGARSTAQVNFGDTDDRELPDPARIVAFSLVTPTRSAALQHPLSRTQRLGSPVLETSFFDTPQSGLLDLTYDNGFWLTTPDRYEINSSRLLVPKGSAPHWTVKYAKMLLGPGAFDRVLHQRLEIVPLADPFALAPSAKLPVRLEYEGKPVSNVAVSYGDGVTPISDDKLPKVRTNAAGLAEIPYSRAGAYLLTVDYTAAPTHPALSESDHLYASLSFDTSR